MLSITLGSDIQNFPKWCHEFVEKNFKHDKESNLKLIYSENKIKLIWDFEGKEYVYIIDLLSNEYQHKLKYTYKKKDIFAKSIGIKNSPGTILDLTAGFLSDSHHLLYYGVDVTALESNPLIFLLANDAIDRAKNEEPMFEKIEIIYTQAQDFLQESSREFDVIYYDPMFPEKKKSALSNKNMQLLQHISEPKQFESFEIIDLSRKRVNQRVVVKRPLKYKDPQIEPDVQYLGKSIRYDVYMANTLRN